MAEVNVARTIAHPAVSAWAILRPFPEIGRYLKAVTQCEASGDEIGAVRRLTFDDGTVVTECLESRDDQAMRLSYGIVEGQALPFSNYLATIHVEAIDQNNCRVHWQGQLQVNEGAPGSIVGMIDGVYRLGLEGLAQLLDQLEHS